jgi:hypothetical protein
MDLYFDKVCKHNIMDMFIIAGEAGAISNTTIAASHSSF